MGRTKYFPTTPARNSQDNTQFGENEDDQVVTAANMSTKLDSTSRRNENTPSVEGYIELQESVHDINESFSEEDEETNDNDLRSVQIVAAQTSKAVVEASQHGRPAKKKRGNVCCRKLINLMPGEKLKVTFDMDCRPVGENSSIFTYFLGQTVRNRTCCPLGVPEWKYIEDHNIDFAWNVVLEKFTMDQPDMRKEFILRHMNALYRDYRRKLKAIYYDDPELINQPQREKNKPKNVVKKDWLYLCNLWHSPDFQKQSKRNKNNRSKLKSPHYSGTKSFARMADELRKKFNREPTRAEILIASRQRKSSKSVDSVKFAENQEIVSKLKNSMREREEGHNNMSDEQIFKEILGDEKHGYLRAYGRNKSITDHFKEKPSRINLANQVIEIGKKADERVEEAKKALEEKMDEKLAERDKMWEERFKELCEKFGAPSSNHDH